MGWVGVGWGGVGWGWPEALSDHLRLERTALCHWDVRKVLREAGLALLIDHEHELEHFVLRARGRSRLTTELSVQEPKREEGAAATTW